jgi:sigma-B regulation protein RsbU (phosphoserine phosphatase)
MDNLNSAIYSRQNRSRFVSILMAALDVNHKRIEYINAGQSKPLLVRDEKAEVLKAEGARFPLGVIESPRYRQNALDLKHGDALLLFTDGVTEAMNPDQDMYGDERLTALFIQLVSRKMSSKEIVQAIKDDVLTFSGAGEQHDDLTIVVIRAI